MRIDILIERLQERHRCVSRADDRGDCRAGKHKSREAITDLSRAQQECARHRVAGIQLCAHVFHQDTENRQEQQYTDHCRDHDTGNGTLLNLRLIFLPGDARVDQTMRARKGDVSADRAAQNRQDRIKRSLQSGRRHKRIFQRVPYRRLHNEDDHQNYDNHDAAQHLRNRIHGCLRILQAEYRDGDRRRDDLAEPDRNAEQRVDTETAAADVTDIEYQTAQHDHERHEVPQTRKQLICDVLSSQSRAAQHFPDIQLRDR